MPNYILFDDHGRENLRPLSFFRPLSELLVGIMSVRKKWEFLFGDSVSWLTEPYLSAKYPCIVDSDNILINSRVLPTIDLVQEIRNLPPESCLVSGKDVVAYRMLREGLLKMGNHQGAGINTVEMKSEVHFINHSYDLIRLNGYAIRQDFELITKGRVSAELPPACIHQGNHLFLEESATLENVSVNTIDGPVYVGRGAHIMNGATLRGPLAIGENSTVKMNASLYGNSTLGRGCKIGGEVSDTIFMDYSNKGHEGFIGHSVIAEWCNLGAGTIVSNLKNNYEKVRLWSYTSERFADTGLQFCGVIMGDHSKTGIHTMINSGTVIGVCCNIFGTGYQRNFISSFQWGGNTGFRKHKLNEASETAKIVYKRRGLEFDETEQNLMQSVFQLISSRPRL